MNAGAVAADASSRSRLGACHLLAAGLPILVMLVSEVLAQPLSLSRGRVENVEPGELTLWLSGIAGFVFALVGVALTAGAARDLELWRMRQGTAKPGEPPVDGAPGVTFVASLVLCSVAGFFFCGAVNRLAGQAITESAQVTDVRLENSRRCAGLRASLYALSLPQGGTLCVDRGKVQAGQTLPILVYTSALGRQIGRAEAYR